MNKIIILFTLLFIIHAPYTHANRTPIITSNLGGMPISCSIYEKQVTVNGIAPGYTMDMIKAVLGTPNYVSSQNTVSYTYEGISIKFADFDGTGKPIAYDIDVWKNGVTSDGVKIGMPESELTKIYGTADNVHIEKNIAPKLNEVQKAKYVDRLDKTIYIYNANQCLNMAFTVNKGVIKKIHIHLSE